MAIFNFGSINIDLVYTVPHFPAPGETLTTTGFMRALGGKGANQSIALAAAGTTVWHIGAMSHTDDWLLSEMQALGVGLTHIQDSAEPTGHAIVSVNGEGENQILLCPGANRKIDMDQALQALQTSAPGDWVLLQNETNGAREFVAAAKEQGLKIAYSAAPFDKVVTLDLLPDCDLLVVNQGEADALMAATGKAPETLGVTHLVITAGAKGATYFGGDKRVHQNAFQVSAVDTTGAGDCFFGFFLAELAGDTPVEAALCIASAAAALQVTKPGAAGAIPARKDVLAFIESKR